MKADAKSESRSAGKGQQAKMSADQVKGRAGGYVWKTSEKAQLRRFLILGTEGATYYASAKELTLENCKNVINMINNGAGTAVVEEVKTISVEGRAPKQTPTMIVLALCARAKDAETRTAAYAALQAICRIPTHLFEFMVYYKKVNPATTGWGRRHKKSVGNWYSSKTPKSLAFSATKYKSRHGWTHRDLLRLCHIKPTSDAQKLVFCYIVKGMEGVAKLEYDKADKDCIEVLDFLKAVDFTSSEAALLKVSEVLALITKHNLAREHLASKLLTNLPIWDALLQKMPMTAMIRNLGKMSSIGLFKKDKNLNIVTKALSDAKVIHKARIHPLKVLIAIKTYRAGKGIKGSLTWPVESKISAALETAFKLSFKNVEPTGKRFCLALDISGSMGCATSGAPMLSCAEASGALALVTASTEPHCESMGFSSSFIPLSINKGMSLATVMTNIRGKPFGGTDCAKAMTWALEKKKKFDVFIVYTDNETYTPTVHPAKALRDYRAKMGIDAKCIVMGMSSNGFTIADPKDPGMLDVVGFDSAIPEIIRDFVNGKV